MRLYYVCECCQKMISEIDLDEIDSLTPSDREDIIKMNNCIYINSLCTECSSALGLKEEQADYYDHVSCE